MDVSSLQTGHVCTFLIEDIAMIPRLCNRIAKLITISIIGGLEIYSTLSLYHRIILLSFGVNLMYNNSCQESG